MKCNIKSAVILEMVTSHGEILHCEKFLGANEESRRIRKKEWAELLQSLQGQGSSICGVAIVPS